jgi:MoxR-like ATPase
VSISTTRWAGSAHPENRSADSPIGVDPAAVAQAVMASVSRVVRGCETTIKLVVCALISGGHVLVEDLPGTGKTTMARAIATSVGGSFGRVQGTVDLMPADITGSGVWEPDLGAFRFIPGPVFANVLVIDELNRTSSRTQSAFMEALDEGAVTVDGVRHPLPDPFFAIATQNPTDHHGTFPLPEGELDRFAVSVSQGELSAATEISVVREQLVRPTVDALTTVVTPEELRQVRDLVRHIHVSDAVLRHAVLLVRSTRQDPRIRQGASSRAALALVRTAQAHAVITGRDFVTPDDTKAVTGAVLGHRLLIGNAIGTQRAEAQRVLSDLTAQVPVALHS